MTASIADKEDLMNAVRDTAARVHAARIECISTGTTAQFETLFQARVAYKDACKALIDRLIIGLDLSPMPADCILKSPALAEITGAIASLSRISTRPAMLDKVNPSATEAGEDDTAGTRVTAEQPDAVVLLADREPVDEDDTAGTQLTARPGDPAISEAGE